MKLLIEAPKRNGLTDICMICLNRHEPCHDPSEWVGACKRFALDEDRAAYLQSNCVDSSSQKEENK